MSEIEGWKLQAEDVQWSIWWRESPGGGLQVSMPEDSTDEEAAREFHALVGGELKVRDRMTLVGEWRNPGG